MLTKMLEYLSSLLAYFGFVPPRVKRYDVALNLLDQIRGNAQILDQASASATGQPGPYGNLPSIDALLLYRQLATLHAYLEKYELLPHDPSQTGLDGLAGTILTSGPHEAIAPRLDNVATLLHIQRALLTGTVKTNPSTNPVSQPTTTEANLSSSGNPPTTLPAAAANEGVAAKATQPDDGAALWKITEKLYDSWPIKILGALLVSAVLLAGGGTLLIGGKALELRKTLEDAGSKETKSLENFAKTTREAVTAQSRVFLADLERQQTEINQKMTAAKLQIQDLESRSTAIEDAAVERVSKDIRNNFSGVERKLKEELESSIVRIKDRDLQDLQGRVLRLGDEVTKLGEQVTNLAGGIREKNDLIASNESKIKTLVETTGTADTLKAQASLIAESKKTADEALQKMLDVRQSALAADKRIKELTGDIESRIKPQMDRIIEDEGKLGGNEKGLQTLTEGIRKVGLDTASTQEILKEAQQANDVLKSITRRLAELTRVADDLDARLKRTPLPAASSPPQALLEEQDLSRDQWKIIQQSLKTRKFYERAIDGKVGDGTRNAIKAYQVSRNSEANGILTPDQIRDLLGQSKI